VDRIEARGNILDRTGLESCVACCYVNVFFLL